MSRKNFLFFSKGEKKGVLVLICLIVIVLVINRVFPHYFRKEAVNMSAYRTEIEKFNNSLPEQDNEQSKLFLAETQRELFQFDPNKLDSTGFVKLGVPPYIVTRVIKYRSKGGVFRKPEDFAKIYGMKESLYKKLQPYIHIENPQKNAFSPALTDRTIAKKEEKQPAALTKIELNSADTAALKKLKSVGTVYAERIVKYREYLGGFHHIEQLKEVYGISEELFLSLKPSLTVDNTQIKKIRLNQDLNMRLKHPYLKKEQLSALIAFQQKNRTFNSFEILKELPAFSDEDLKRLIPYLSLE